MRIVVEKRGRVAVVSVEGSVDGTTAGELTAALHGQVSGGARDLVIDIAGVDYMSSAGLRALLKEARKQGGDLRPAAARPEVLRVLDLSGFTSILQVFPDVDSAVASFPA